MTNAQSGSLPSVDDLLAGLGIAHLATMAALERAQSIATRLSRKYPQGWPTDDRVMHGALVALAGLCDNLLGTDELRATDSIDRGLILELRQAIDDNQVNLDQLPEELRHRLRAALPILHAMTAPVRRNAAELLGERVIKQRFDGNNTTAAVAAVTACKHFEYAILSLRRLKGATTAS